MTTTTSLAPLLERFFTQRLMQQHQASPHTIKSYRDSFRQFLIFAQQHLRQPPRLLSGGRGALAASEPIWRALAPAGVAGRSTLRERARHRLQPLGRAAQG